jgi:hypothetical protein
MNQTERDAAKDEHIRQLQRELNDALDVVVAAKNLREEWERAKFSGDLEPPVKKIIAAYDKWDARESRETVNA